MSLQRLSRELKAIKCNLKGILEKLGCDMKHLRILILSIAVVLIFSACAADADQPDARESETTSQIPSEVTSTAESSPVKENSVKDNSTKLSEDPAAMPTINIYIGNQSFQTTLYDNPSAKALLKELPLTVDMRELNGNEKYFNLSKNLPSAAVRVNGIQAGDLMLYGSDCLVLFYESFSTSYSYTPLGRIKEPAGLAEALGNGNVSVTFELKK